jgi:hypothetical protein
MTAKSASRKSMRPASKVTPAQSASGKGGQGTVTTAKAKPEPIDLDALLTTTLSTFGAPGDALDNVEAAHAAAAAADSAVVAWVTFVEARAKEGRSGRAFGEAVKAATGKGNPNTFGRLQDVGALP